MIFVGDMGDFLSRAVTDEFLLNELFGAMTSELGRRHFWMLLTKRPKRLAEISRRMPGGLPENCMAMTTATDQRTANVRVRQLLEVECQWRGLSCEPLLSEVRIKKEELRRIHLVIGGGESGDKDADVWPTHPAWLRLLRDQCVAANVPFFMKQHGDWIPSGMRPDVGKSFPFGSCLARGAQLHQWGDGTVSFRVGKKRANKAGYGRLLDGREWNEMPPLASARLVTSPCVQ
jgi:protein gp37